jgi:hypothetical protein
MLAAALGVPTIAVHGGSPWVKSMEDGFDPYLPALRHATGQGVADAMGVAEPLCREWMAKLANGQEILPKRSGEFR